MPIAICEQSFPFSLRIVRDKPHRERPAATDLADGGKEDIQPVDETTPEFRDCHFSDIICAGAQQAVYVNGLPELPVRNLDFRNCVFSAKKGVETNYFENVTFENVLVNGEKI